MTFTQEHLVGVIDFRHFYASEGVVFCGRNGRARCVFHDDRDPSLSVDLVRGLFKCHGCGASGDAVSFVARRLRLSEADAIVALRRRFGIVGPAS
jgi:DNA primase